MDKKKLTLGLLAGGAILILLTSFLKIWWSAGPISVGPLGAEICHRGECESMSLSKASGAWGAMGIMTFIFGLIGALAAGGAAYSAATGKKMGNKPFTLGTTALVGAGAFLLFAILFLATVPSKGGRGAPGMSAGFPLALIGAGLVGTGAFFLRQMEEAGFGGGAPMGAMPMGAMPMGGAPMGGMPMGGAPMGGAPMAMGGQPPQAAAPTTPCTRCGAPARWIAEHNRWFCDREQQYL